MHNMYVQCFNSFFNAAGKGARTWTKFFPNHPSQGKWSALVFTWMSTVRGVFMPLAAPLPRHLRFKLKTIKLVNMAALNTHSM